jgi:hypothetical protein
MTGLLRTHSEPMQWMDHQGGTQVAVKPHHSSHTHNDSYNATRQQYCRCHNADAAASTYTPTCFRSSQTYSHTVAVTIHPTSCRLSPLVQGPSTSLHHNCLQRWLQHLVRFYTRHMTNLLAICHAAVLNAHQCYQTQHMSPPPTKPQTTHMHNCCAHKITMQSPASLQQDFAAEKQDGTTGGAYCDADTPNPVQRCLPFSDHTRHATNNPAVCNTQLAASGYAHVHSVPRFQPSQYGQQSICL